MVGTHGYVYVATSNHDGRANRQGAQAGPFEEDDEVLRLGPVLANEIARMEAEGISTVRLLEGGTHNTNIRYDEHVTPDTTVYRSHPRTVDVWVVRKGSGTLVTGGRIVNDELVGGLERVIGEGDLVFIPAGTLHGIKETTSITWLNIRYDVAE